MFEGKPIQEYDINAVSSVRRNPVIADLFHRLKYMERRGSGLKKIFSETEKLPGYTEELRPFFFSTSSDFRVVLKNVNYPSGSHNPQDNLQDNLQVSPQDNRQAALSSKIILYCKIPRSKREIAQYCGYRDIGSFTSHYLKPLINSGYLRMTIPEKPNSKNQRYVKV